MGWSSATKVLRISEAACDRAWEELWTLKRSFKVYDDAKGGWGGSGWMGGDKESRGVCCFYIQGNCFYGLGCPDVHDKELLDSLGCSFGSTCRLRHGKARSSTKAADDGAAAEKPVQDEAPPPPPSSPSPPSSTSALLLASLTGALPGAARLECEGPAFDDSDPLWDEVAAAFREPSPADEDVVKEDLGDGDISGPARARLNKAHQYWVVDEEMADEWLRMPGDVMLERLRAAQVRVGRLRGEWVHYDLVEAQALWEEDVNVAGASEAAGGAMGRADALLREVFEEAARLPKYEHKGPKELGGAGGACSEVPASLQAKCASADEALQEVERQRRERTENGGGASWSGVGALAVGSDQAFYYGSMEAGVSEIRKALQRCLFIGRALQHDVQVEALAGDADADLHTGGSGAGVGAGAGAGAGADAASRSRSPRGREPAIPGAAAVEEGREAGGAERPGSLLELAAEAARRGEHVLIHHIVERYDDPDE